MNNSTQQTTSSTDALIEANDVPTQDNLTPKQHRKLEKLAQKNAKKQERLAKKKAAKDKNDIPLTAEQQQALLDKKLATIAKQQRDNKKWYKLDNAALMYPLVARRESISVFGLSATLAKDVDPVALQYAVNDICVRFPTICGTVKNGFFWPFIDKPTTPIVVKKQTKLPGRPMKMDNKRSQVRIYYYANKITVEFFHSATDGTGGMIFLNSLLRCYFGYLGIECEKNNCWDHRDKPTLAEIRDNFANVAVKKNPPPLPPIVKSGQLNGTTFKNKKYIVTRGICSASQLHDVAKKYNATITEFLNAVQLLALEELRKATSINEKRPLRVMVPVNLRSRYNVETVRNFSSYVFTQYNGQTEIEDIVKDVRQQMETQLTDDYFRGMVSYNYNSGNHPLLKVVPLFVKRLVLSAIVKGRGDGIVNCSTISNLGVVKTPKEFEENVLRFEFMLGKPAKHTNNFAVATYNDICTISVTNAYAEMDCERFFFRKLTELGVDFAIESDVWAED